MPTDSINTRQTEMFAVIKNYLGSGLSQKKFCLQQNLAINTFYYWLKRYREQNEPSSPSAFLPLRMKTAQVNFACVLELPNGVKVCWREVPETAMLRALSGLK